MSHTSGFCSVCGTPIGPEVRFCPNCGTPAGRTLPQNVTAPQQVSAMPQDAAYFQALIVPHPEQLRIHCPTLPPGAFMTSFWLIVLTLLSCLICGIAVIVESTMMIRGEHEILPGQFGFCSYLFFFILYMIALCRFLYRCWRLIQDGYAHTTPGKAVGFNFIPFFQIYWIFISVYCLAKDLNAYAARYQITAPRARKGLVLTGLIFLWIPYLQPFALLLLPIGFFSMARTAEAIQDARRPGAGSF
ncbi:MAG: zinc ribbon domain-containing protein [Thermoguttaceae bacterium]|nr:zinc ribbon domain-containing protein [Thermoguttaceae bacterium]